MLKFVSYRASLKYNPFFTTSNIINYSFIGDHQIKENKMLFWSYDPVLCP